MQRPFEFAAEPRPGGPNEAELYLKVRTTSWDFDGERTDLHDVLSLLWAATLRSKEVASVRLVSALNPAHPSGGEIHSRYLLLAQPGRFEPGSPLNARAQAASLESSAMRDLMAELFGTAPHSADHGDPGYNGSPAREWIVRVRELLGLGIDDGEGRTRSYPQWTYFGSHQRGVSVVELGERATCSLRKALAGFSPQKVDGVQATLYRTQHFFNAARLDSVNLLLALIKEVDGAESEAMIVPIDSHVVAVGRHCVAAVRDRADRELYDAELEQLETRHAHEAAFLCHDVMFEWAQQLDDARFEAFVGDLLLVEPGVARVRQVGDTRERDDGRDFLVDWLTTPDRSNELWQEPKSPISVFRHVVVQAKIRRGGVGRAHLTGLRDTLEHYRCDGLLVVAYPRVTSQLTTHLEELRRRGQYWVEWWGKTQLEERLRRHPQIAKRYPDVVKLRDHRQ